MGQEEKKMNGNAYLRLILYANSKSYLTKRITLKSIKQNLTIKFSVFLC